MGKKIDLTGQTFGWLTVLYENSDRRYKDRVYWVCRCKCGTIKAVRSGDLRSGKTISCGCYHKQDVSKRFRITGKSKSKIRGVYKEMKARCNNPNNKEYKNYGQRGIKVCDEWNQEYGFKSFYDWAMANGYSEGLSIERIDVNGNYEPSNCCWIEKNRQASNTRKNKYLTYKGITHTYAQWGRIVGCDYHMIERRLRDNCLDDLLGNFTLDELLSTNEILYPPINKR